MENNNRFTGVEFDAYVASTWKAKYDSCKSKKVDFNLTILQVRNMLLAKRCHITGVEMTHHNTSSALRGTDVTLDRMDNSKGYIKGNVHAVCNAANNFKSMFENPNATIGVKQAKKIIKALEGVKAS